MRTFIKQNEIKSWASANLLWAMANLHNAIPTMTQLLSDLVEVFPAKTRSMTAQELANCLWALAQLRNVEDVSQDDVAKLVATLAVHIPGKVKEMKPQELSNCLWAAAQLKDVKDVAPNDVVNVVSALAAQIPSKTDGMKHQELSNCLWAAARLKNAAPEVLKCVPALVAQIPDSLDDMKALNLMKPQDFANNLQALVLLEEVVPEAGHLLHASFLRLAAVQFSQMLPELSDRELHLGVPVVVWACARSGMRDQSLLKAVQQRFMSIKKFLSLTNWGLCALTWSYCKLDVAGEFKEFERALQGEVSKRGLSEADVQRSQVGYFEELEAASRW